MGLGHILRSLIAGGDGALDDHPPKESLVYVDPALSYGQVNPSSVRPGNVFVVEGKEALRALLDGGAFHRTGPVILFFPDSSQFISNVDPRLDRLVKSLHERSIARGVILPQDIIGGISISPEQATIRRRYGSTLSQIVDEALGDREHPRNVFYPFAGYDAATAVAAFRKADLFLLVDYYPFLLRLKGNEGLPVKLNPFSEADILTGSSDPANMTSVVEILHVGNLNLWAGGALALMLNRMKAFFENFSVRSIQYFFENRRVFVADKTPLACNGIVSFDIGDNRPKTIIYLNTGVEDVVSNEPDRSIDIGFIDGLLVKGTNGFRKYLYIISTLIEMLRTNGGVIIEGHESGRKYELFSGRRVLPIGSRILGVSPHFRLSYDDGLRVVAFSPLDKTLPTTDHLVQQGGLYVFARDRQLIETLVGGGPTDFTAGDFVHITGAGKVFSTERMRSIRSEALARIEASVIRAGEMVRGKIERF